MFWIFLNIRNIFPNNCHLMESKVHTNDDQT